MPDSSTPNPSAVLIALKTAWADDSLTLLVPDGDPRAAILVGGRGVRVAARKLSQYRNTGDFFITPDEYHSLFPVANPVTFIHFGDGVTTQEGAEEAQKGAEAPTQTLQQLDASNSVVVERRGDVMEDLPEQEQPNGSTRRKKK